MKKLFFLSILTVLTGFVFAQDDELPPPSSKPRQTEEKKDDQKPPDAKDFQGFQKKKKVDFSKFIIEPNVNFSISTGRIDAGFSPYVGYKVWKELFVGGGVTYQYSGYTNYPVPNTSGKTISFGLHTYGGGVFVQYNIWRGFFARVKLELLGRKIPTDIDYVAPYKVTYINKFTPALPVGVGYNMLRSKNFFMPVSISYDLFHSVVDKRYSVYPRGIIIQLGFISIF